MLTRREEESADVAKFHFFKLDLGQVIVYCPKTFGWQGQWRGMWNGGASSDIYLFEDDVEVSPFFLRGCGAEQLNLLFSTGSVDS